ncbi:MAG: hypothetical protein HQL77_05260 [Magnetococcales bacterium]|nr:hypothetical protein [Magnetococcales bacterium]
MLHTGKIILALVGLLLSWSAWAHGSLAPQHGGRMVEAEGGRLELVAKDTKVDLYVTDHDDKPIAVAGASAKVVILAGGKKLEVALQGADGNLLSGTTQTPVGDAFSAVITVSGLAKPISARLPAQH